MWQSEGYLRASNWGHVVSSQHHNSRCCFIFVLSFSSEFRELFPKKVCLIQACWTQAWLIRVCWTQAWLIRAWLIQARLTQAHQMMDVAAILWVRWKKCWGFVMQPVANVIANVLVRVWRAINAQISTMAFQIVKTIVSISYWMQISYKYLQFDFL